jgi:hypothetical protein
MNESRIAKMTDKVAGAEADDPLALVDQSIDMMIRCTQIINENITKIETESVPQKVAVDEVQGLLDEGVAPYLADVVKAMSVFAD